MRRATCRSSFPMQPETMLSNTELQSEFIPMNLPVVDETMVIETTTPVKKRRASRTLSARLSRILKNDNTETNSSQQGYIFKDADGVIAVCYEDDNESMVRLPDSLRDRFSDPSLQSELIATIESMRKGLSKKDDFKIHLDKEAPAYLYFAYTVNGGPKSYYYADPTEVNVGPDAFEDIDEHASFHKAVLQQNFNNVAYKKWREQYKKQFEKNIIAQELVKMYGTAEEQARHTAFQEEVLRMHAGRKLMTRDDSTESPETITTIESIEEATPSLEEFLPTTADELIASVMGNNTNQEQVEEELPTVMFTPISSITPPVEVVNVTPTPSYQAPIITSFAKPLVTLQQLQNNLRKLQRLESDLEYYNGPFGELVQLVHGVEYDNILSEFTEVSEQYDKARHEWVLHTLGAYLADELSFATPKYWGHAYRTGTTYSDASLADLQDWLARAEHGSLATVSYRLLVESSIKGMIATALLGVAPHVYAARPSVFARMASFFGTNDANYDYLQQALHNMSAFSAWDNVESALTDEQMLQNALTYFELHAALSGEALQSADRYTKTYDPRYATILKQYEQRIASQYSDQDEEWLPEMPEFIQDSAPEMEEEVTGEQIQELAQAITAAEEQDQMPANQEVSTEELMAFTQASQDTNDVWSQLDAYVSSCAECSAPTDLDQLSTIENIARLGHPSVSARAKNVLSRWSDTERLRDNGIMSISLSDNESLFAALQRTIRAHGDYFTQTPGTTPWEKACALLDEIYQYKNLGHAPKNHEELIALGEPGEMICYDNSGKVCYLQS